MWHFTVTVLEKALTHGSVLEVASRSSAVVVALFFEKEIQNTSLGVRGMTGDFLARVEAGWGRVIRG